MKPFLKLLIMAFMMVGRGQAGTMSKCKIVRFLRRDGVPDSDLRDWLCLVKHESNFQYDAVGSNSDGSKDYGIYQINDKYWCGRGTSDDLSGPCWQFNTNGCGFPCSKLLNQDPDFDTTCAVKIKNCNNFDKWYGWRDNCKGRDLTSNSDYDYSGC